MTVSWVLSLELSSGIECSEGQNVRAWLFERIRNLKSSTEKVIAYSDNHQPATTTNNYQRQVTFA